ncbi:MAG: hypothetical protein Q7R92_03635 [bacterium]|nr:hypothetical protein [bacterium]
MKIYAKYSIITFVVAFLLALLTWRLQVGIATLMLFQLGYGIHSLRKTYPWIAVITGSIISVVIICGLLWWFFRINFPLSYDTFPWGKNYRDAQIAKFIDPGLSEARSVLFLELRKKDDALAADIPNLMKDGKYDEIKKRTQELIDHRKEIEKLIAQTDPPPAPNQIPSAAQPVIELKKGDKRLYEISDDGYSSRIFVPSGVHYDLTSTGGKPYEVVFDNGLRIAVVPGEPHINAPTVNPCIFRIYSKEKQGILIEGN